MLQWKGYEFYNRARTTQHTNSQLETLWTLQVRVVIIDVGLYQATWYTMDGLNCKQYIHNPILTESTIYINLIKPCYPHTQSVLDTNLKILSAVRHLFLKILIRGIKVSLLSKKRPKNFVSGTIVIGELYYSIITWCFSYWPSYRSKACCIGLRIPLLINQSTMMTTI